jgi:hypothetical protein
VSRTSSGSGPCTLCNVSFRGPGLSACCTSSGSGPCMLYNVSFRGPGLSAHCTSSVSGPCTLCTVLFRVPGLPDHCTSSGSGAMYSMFIYCVISGPWLSARCMYVTSRDRSCVTDCQHYNFYGSSATPTGPVKERQEEKAPLALSGGLPALC